ncbi:uncharacterized protein EI90DRAFT_2015930 [Cantharellus anzutake]|uniref:uncharacterized protein n=1 Tax=Cantharellus anzutake TaxID=1750568 RepID=UPI001906F84E|nr:uncharacterized protein EI90DRAFT_2015930 [Cantharellus anzutake]KAF8325771.1 hypothetical protein EI90DRAFT_2015930 [Cantharellus anzutake]
MTRNEHATRDFQWILVRFWRGEGGAERSFGVPPLAPQIKVLTHGAIIRHPRLSFATPRSRFHGIGPSSTGLHKARMRACSSSLRQQNESSLLPEQEGGGGFLAQCNPLIMIGKRWYSRVPHALVLDEINLLVTPSDDRALRNSELQTSSRVFSFSGFLSRANLTSSTFWFYRSRV